MPRNMSFAMTTEQIRNRSKTVTRRFGWWFLKPGDTVNAVEKSMGLKKGEKVKRICQIRIISTRREPLDEISEFDVVDEGFPTRSPAQFVEMLVKHYGCKPDAICNRIRFEYVEKPATPLPDERSVGLGPKGAAGCAPLERHFNERQL